MTHAAYITPNPINTLDLMQPHLLSGPMPTTLYPTAEILACMQTIAEAMDEFGRSSKKRHAAAETWHEMAGDIVRVLPSDCIRIQSRRSAFDPLSEAKRDYPPSDNPPAFRRNLMMLLEVMVQASRQAVGGAQKFTDNYHSVIVLQLSRLGMITSNQCAQFCREVVHLPVPTIRSGLGLVYPRDYSVDESSAPSRSWQESQHASDLWF